MQPLLLLQALVAVLGLLLPGGVGGGAPDHGPAEPATCNEGGPLEPRHERALGALPPAPAAAVEPAHEEERAPDAQRSGGSGPPAAPVRRAPLGCTPPRRTGERGPLAPGESSPAQAFLRVNGVADAGGARG